ncbi:MAG: hypothetical protein KDK90_26320 [Leptospiraceae bacterium]|nr:hypothetical protein [Leptospiraceae bacterium]
MPTESPWNSIQLEEELKTPENIVRELFLPLKDKTNDKVTFELHKVNYFPEEVVIRTENIIPSFTTAKEVPHPDFGYEPEISIERQFFRFRLLLLPTSNKEIKYEFFKFKYPLLFYPIHVYLNAFLLQFFSEYDVSDNKFIILKHEKDLYSFIYKIIRLDSTIQLIKRLMVL